MITQTATPIQKAKSNDAVFFEIWQKSKLFATDKIKTPPVCLSYGDGASKTAIGTLGSFSMIIGRPKSRKTFFVSALAGVAINNSEHLGIKGSFPKNKNRVLYFDTEQSKYHAKKVLDRILKINEMDKNTHPENLDFMLLSPYAPERRLEIIDFVIKNSKNVGLVIIDGIKDVVTSINDESEATKVSTKLLEWITNYNIHIITVLHQNKNDENARGHIGTELENKAESVIIVRKSGEQPECSTVESKTLRDVDFDTFAFGIDENNVPYATEITSEGISKKKQQVGELTNDQMTKLLEAAFGKQKYLGWTRLRNNLYTASKTFGFFLNQNKCTELMQMLPDLGLIKKERNQYRMSFNEMPFS